MRRILIVGVGSIGERHVRCLLGTKRADVGICEINAELRQSIALTYSIKEAFGSLQEALACGWHAAVIATPAHLHISIALDLARAGVHLLIEKPLSTSLDGTETLVEQVEAGGLVAAVAYIYRAHPGLLAMRQAIRSGQHGRPVQLMAQCGHHLPSDRPAYREIYFADRKQGGGAIQDALTHMLNAGEWLVGPIDKLVADAEHKVLDGIDVEDTVNLLCRHGDVLGVYCLNEHQAPREVSITVICEGGTVRFELHRNRWRWMTEPNGTWQNEDFNTMDRDDWFTLQSHAFLDALEGKADPLCTLGEGVQTLKVNLAALASADESTYWKEIPVAGDQVRVNHELKGVGK